MTGDPEMTDSATHRQLERVGVVGGGTMGSGIVHVLLAAGLEVVLVESNTEFLQRADGLVRKSLDGAAQRGKLSATPEQLLERLRRTTDRTELSSSELVIEAVPEIVDLKTDLLTALEGIVGEDTILASNTSSLSVTQLGKDLRRPERLVGLHFFNPVPASALVEIVRTEKTDAATLASAHHLAKLLGKETVEVSDSPGFATSRLGVALGLEAVRMVEEGVGSPEEIDKAMVLGYRYPMGPLRLGDLVGHDVRLGIATYLHSTLGARFEPPALLRRMVAEGKLGKKSGEGFYKWD